jgi:DNA polymerase III epsilon subunit-like protein
MENVASLLKIANGAEHRALSDARLVKDVFLAMLRHTPTVRTITDVEHLSPPFTFDFKSFHAAPRRFALWTGPHGQTGKVS